MTDKLMQTRRKTFGKFVDTLNTPYRRCYAPSNNCESEPIRAHSVQNAVVLEALQSNGHVIAPKLKVSFERGPHVEFAKLGRNQATTFHGLCSAHDREIFGPIETQPIDPSNTEHLFLLSYRAVLREAHATAKSAINVQSGYVAGVEAGLFPAEPSVPGLAAVEYMALAHQVHMHKLVYDLMFLTGSWNSLAHHVRDLNVPPSIAVNSLLSCKRFSPETDSMAYATLNVFPHRETTMLAFSYRNEHRHQFSKSFGRFLSSGGILEQVSYLVLKRCENFVLSPAHFEKMDDHQRAECLRFYERNMGDNSYEPEDPWLINLFVPR
jgi:hypothetical protein